MCRQQSGQLRRNLGGVTRILLAVVGRHAYHKEAQVEQHADDIQNAVQPCTEPCPAPPLMPPMLVFVLACPLLTAALVCIITLMAAAALDVVRRSDSTWSLTVAKDRRDISNRTK